MKVSLNGEIFDDVTNLKWERITEGDIGEIITKDPYSANFIVDFDYMDNGVKNHLTTESVILGRTIDLSKGAEPPEKQKLETVYLQRPTKMKLFELYINPYGVAWFWPSRLRSEARYINKALWIIGKSKEDALDDFIKHCYGEFKDFMIARRDDPRYVFVKEF